MATTGMAWMPVLARFGSVLEKRAPRTLVGTEVLVVAATVVVVDPSVVVVAASVVVVAGTVVVCALAAAALATTATATIANAATIWVSNGRERVIDLLGKKGTSSGV